MWATSQCFAWVLSAVYLTFMKIGPGERAWIADKLLQTGIWGLTVVLFATIPPYITLIAERVPVEDWWQKLRSEGELVALAAIILVDAFGKFVWAGFKKEDSVHKAWSLCLAMLVAIIAIALMAIYTAAKIGEQQTGHGAPQSFTSFPGLGSTSLLLEWSCAFGFYATIWAGEE
jgi:hypothetical protein